MTGEGREWVLLAEAARRTGLSVDALRKRAQRNRIEAMKGNDGLVRIRVSAEELAALRPHSPTVQTTSGHEEQEASESSPLVDILREQLDRAQADADMARAAHATDRERWEARLDALRAEAETARKDATGERERAAEERQNLQTNISQLQTDLARTAEARTLASMEAERLRAQLANAEATLDAERKRGWLARLLGRR